MPCGKYLAAGNPINAYLLEYNLLVQIDIDTPFINTQNGNPPSGRNNLQALVQRLIVAGKFQDNVNSVIFCGFHDNLCNILPSGIDSDVCPHLLANSQPVVVGIRDDDQRGATCFSNAGSKETNRPCAKNQN